MASSEPIYITIPGPSELGLISNAASRTVSYETLRRKIDALLNDDIGDLVEDEPEPVLDCTYVRRPIQSLADRLGLRGADGLQWKSSNDYSTVNHSKSEEIYTYKVPHFKFGVAYSPEEPLVNRSRYGASAFDTEIDLVYYHTIRHPETYPQDSLLEASRPETSPTTFSNESSSYSPPSTSSSSRSRSKDARNEDNPEAEMGIVRITRKELTKLRWKVLIESSNEAQSKFFEKEPHLRAFGEVKEVDMPEIEVGDVLTWLTNKVDNTHRCILCRTVDLNISSTQHRNEDGGQSRRLLNHPTIIKHEGSGDEIAPLLPSFNRMVLNCQESSCSQCWFFLKTLIAAYGSKVFEDDIDFDREALIQCCPTPPLSITVEQYMNILSEELQKSSPGPVPALTLAIRTPRKHEHPVLSRFREISLLIEKRSLPLSDMQGGGEFIDLNGVDLARVSNWWAQCRNTHGRACRVAKRDRYLGKEAAGYLLRLVDVDENRVVIAQPGSSYVALSYVWPKMDSAFKTQKKDFSCVKTDKEELPIRDNITAYFDIPSERLPKIIKDALRVTRAIGEKYLWVDALCIIQDDMLDVQRTIYKMNEIYRGASLTIIMGDCQGVVFEGGRLNLRQFSQELGDTTYILPFPSMPTALDQSVWNSRGWTYQEWFFSTRKLVFLNNLAYYNCPCAYCQEDHVDGPLRMNDTKPNSIETREGTNEYCHHVELYSSRSLTNSTDIIEAFQGIINFMELKMATEFSWGLPVAYFDGAMLWMGVDKLSRRTEKKAPRLDAASVSFPSWSWVGWQGAVKFRPDYHTDNREERSTSDSQVDRLGHIKALITWPWEEDFELPPKCPSLKNIISDIVFRGILRVVTSVARVNVERLRSLFKTQGISGWKLDDGTIVTNGWQTCIVLSEVERPQIGGRHPRIGEIAGRSPITTYNVLVVEEIGDTFERRGLVKITRKIWEACEPKIRWITLV